MTVRHASINTHLGLVTATMKDEHLAAVHIGQNPPQNGTADQNGLADVLQHLEALTLGEERHIPYTLNGTDTQVAAWMAAAQTQAGQTITYSELAKQITQQTGRQASARSAAKAISSNHLALVIPCHRVIGSDGKLHGYKWGLEIKEKLLHAEAQRTSAHA